MVNYVLKPSLEHIALVKVAGMLWCQDDIKDLVANFSFSQDCEEENWQRMIEGNFSFSQDCEEENWQRIEGAVIKKLAKLSLTSIFNDKISEFIRHVGLEIFKWMRYHRENCGLKLDPPNDLCWTSQGIVNKRKTAEKLIKDETMDIATRYKLSCIYCLEDDILKLWNKIPEDCRKSFYSEEDPLHVKQHELVVFWTYNIKGEITKFNNAMEKKFSYKGSPQVYGFEISAHRANKDATEYFLQKLSPIERQEILVPIACAVATVHWSAKFSTILQEYYSEIFFNLLSQMEEEQQKEVFKSHYIKVLECLCDWPWQIFFMETASHNWNLLLESRYCFFFSLLQLAGADHHRGLNFQQLFKEFWQQSPDVLKKSFINDYFRHGSIDLLLKYGDEDNLKMIFQYASDEEKKRVIFDDHARDIFIDLMEFNKWNILKFFIKECLPSKTDLVAFKESLENDNLWRFDHIERRKSRWNILHSLVNDFVHEFDERKCIKSGNKN